MKRVRKKDRNSVVAWHSMQPVPFVGTVSWVQQ